MYLLFALVGACAEAPRSGAPCMTDLDCAFDRICLNRECTDPPPGCVENCDDDPPPPPPPPPGPCTDHSDCAFGERCDFETGRCIDASRVDACETDADCDPPNTICDDDVKRCVVGCNDDPCHVGYVCNEATGHCEPAPTCGVDRFEPNDSSGDASRPSRHESNLRACASDDDYYALDLIAGDAVEARLDFDPAEGAVTFELLGETATTSVMPGLTSLAFDVPASGVYNFRVHLDEDRGDVLGAPYELAFDIELAPCVDDDDEDDDAPGQAKPAAGTITGRRLCEADDDYFMIDAVTDDVLRIDASFGHDEGNLDVELIDPNGVVVADGTSTSDDETVMHTVATDGMHYVRVFLAGDAGTVAGVPYALSVGHTTPPRCVADGFEPNDSSAAATPLTAGAHSSLSICPSDEDFYSFVAPPNASLSIDVAFSDAEGDIDLELLDATGTQVALSDSDTDDESIRHTVTSSGTYVVRVLLWGDDGSVPGNVYDLDLGVSACLYDAMEPNDARTSAVATPLGTHSNLASCPSNEDWYAVQIGAGQTLDASVTFSHAEGDIDIQLYNPQGATVVSSVTASDNEQLALQSLNGGTYTLRVYLYADTGSQPGNPYDLSLSLR